MSLRSSGLRKSSPVKTPNHLNITAMDQLELFDQQTAAPAIVPTAKSVRERIESILDFLRSSPASHVSEKDISRWKLAVPQMSDWLPADDRDVVRAEFSKLIQKL